jgi:hypothetical protein
VLKGFALLWYHRFHPILSCNIRPPPICNNADDISLPSYLDSSIIDGATLSPWTKFILRAYASTDSSLIFYNAVGQVTREDIVLSALDQHCSPITTLLTSDNRYQEVVAKCKEILTQGDDTISEEKFDEELRGMIWYFRSSLNIRRSVYKDGPPVYDLEAEVKRLQPTWSKCWELIRDPLDWLSYEFLRKRLAFN